jgi:hypothetical protein
MLELKDAAMLLDPEPLELEMGVERLPSGQLHVAARTDMPGCSGAMFEWWFRFAPDTRQYRWWHPLDHVSSAWRETNPRTHIGSTHVVAERLAGDAVHPLQINFQDADEFFGADALRDARERGSASAAVFAHIGIGEDPPRDARGRPIGGRLMHLGRDTPFGMTLRSHFWLGVSEPPSAPTEQPVPQEIGLGLMRHAYNEFVILARFLPSLYVAEQGEQAEIRAAVPW